MKYLIEKLPCTLEELSRLLPVLTKDPEGAAAACVLALNVIAQGKGSADDIMKAINPDISPSSIRLAESQLSPKPYLMKSYFSGTSPENGYSLPETLEMALTTNKYSGSREDGKIKFFIECSGADSPRPITLHKRSDGKWFASEWSSLVVGIRPPSE